MLALIILSHAYIMLGIICIFITQISKTFSQMYKHVFPTIFQACHYLAHVSIKNHRQIYYGHVFYHVIFNSCLFSTNGHRLIHHDHAPMSFPIHVLVTIIHLFMSAMHVVSYAHFKSCLKTCTFHFLCKTMIFLSYLTFLVMHKSLLAMLCIRIYVNLSFHPYVFYIRVCLLSQLPCILLIVHFSFFIQIQV